MDVSNGFVIRQETPEDYEAVYELIRSAFLTAEHRDGNEQDLVAALRKGEAFIPQLSLVAQEGKEILGYVLFTRAWAGEKPLLALAPLAVSPKRQRQGIGSALVREGHRIARELGYGYAAVPVSYTHLPCDYCGGGGHLRMRLLSLLSALEEQRRAQGGKDS